MPDQMFAGHFAGQPWRVTLDASPLTGLPEVPERDPEPDSLSRASWAKHVERMDQIANQIADWMREQVIKVSVVGGSEDLREFIERLEYADRAYEIHDVWEEFYDWADRNRVWIDTFGLS